MSIGLWKRHPQGWAGYVLVAIFYCLLMAFTTWSYFGDSLGYSRNIVAEAEHPSSSPVQIWEAGHLYWRELGLTLYRHFGALTPYARSGENDLAAGSMLIACNYVSGLVCALFFYSISLRLLPPGWAPLLVSTGMLGFYAFLNFAHTGASYVPGTMGLLISLWAALQAVDRNRKSWPYALASGAAFAFAVLVWLPYLFVLPGVLAAVLLWPSQSPFKRSRRLAFFIAASAVCMIVLGYCFVILQLKFSTWAELNTWFWGANHGWSQNKRLVRLASGLARSFLYTGDDGMSFKRYLLKDPYAHVTFADLLRQHLWKLALFYAFCASLVWVLWRSTVGRRIFWICFAAALPALGFAAFIFESGSAERYLPLYPFVFLAIVYCVSQRSVEKAAARLAIGFLILAFLMNTSWLWKTRVEAELAAPADRAQSLAGRVTPQGLVALLSHHDDVYILTGSYPFHPVSRSENLPVYDVVETGTLRVLTWRQDFAQRAMDVINRSQSVWISKRLLADRPDPAWDWTEGDDPRVSWKELPLFFRQFDYCEDVGGSDGFLKLDPLRNREKLNRGRSQSAGKMDSWPPSISRKPVSAFSRASKTAGPLARSKRCAYSSLLVVCWPKPSPPIETIHP